jgi:two-component system response regulator FlrC
MRMLIVAIPNKPLGAAAKIAIGKGAPISLVSDGRQAVDMLRSGGAVDLLLVDVGVDVGNIVRGLDAESINIPVIGCGTANDIRTAVTTVRAGANEYISLLPDPDVIAAMLVALANGMSDLVDSDEAVNLVVEVAEQVKPSSAMIRPTLADVERDLILDTLRHCLGNRTRAANILGISVRTLRNKLNDYAADGMRVPPPFGGELRALPQVVPLRPLAVRAR